MDWQRLARRKATQLSAVIDQALAGLAADEPSAIKQARGILMGAAAEAGPRVIAQLLDAYFSVAHRAPLKHLRKAISSANSVELAGGGIPRAVCFA